MNAHAKFIFADEKRRARVQADRRRRGIWLAISIGFHGALLIFLSMLPAGKPGAISRTSAGQAAMGSLVEVALLKADRRPDTKLPASKLPSKTAERLIHFKAPIPLPQPKPDISNDAAPATPSTEAEQSFDAAGRLTLSGDAAAIATSFQRQLLAHIEPYRRYPAEAKQAKIEGSVQLLFTMDRGGRILAIRVLNSSGNRALDREAVETVLRSQPLPAIPNDLPDPLNIALPVDFNLSQISGITF